MREREREKSYTVERDTMRNKTERKIDGKVEHIRYIASQRLDDQLQTNTKIHMQIQNDTKWFLFCDIVYVKHKRDAFALCNTWLVQFDVAQPSPPLTPSPFTSLFLCPCKFLQLSQLIYVFAYIIHGRQLWTRLQLHSNYVMCGWRVEKPITSTMIISNRTRL